MSDYITTYTGNHIDPADPDPEAISIRDIAHALSLICRGNGHVRNFWSVGQHCLDCAHEAQARKLSPRMILACLLHDASECYMSDVPRPMKKHMQEYQRQEKGILKVIFEKFLGSDLTTAEIRELKEIDDALLWHDLGDAPGGDAAWTDAGSPHQNRLFIPAVQGRGTGLPGAVLSVLRQVERSMGCKN